MRLALARSCAFALVGLCATAMLVADQQPGAATRIVPLDDYVCPNALLHGCPGNYCPKPLPCIQVFCPKCDRNDYCCKPLPCVRCFGGPWRCDSYCPKPMPCPCRPLAADFYTCNAGNANCPCANQPVTEQPPVAGAVAGAVGGAVGGVSDADLSPPANY